MWFRWVKALQTDVLHGKVFPSFMCNTHIGHKGVIERAVRTMRAGLGRHSHALTRSPEVGSPGRGLGHSAIWLHRSSGLQKTKDSALKVNSVKIKDVYSVDIEFNN